MKLLLDAKILWRLTIKFKTYFEDCFHVDNIGLALPVMDIDSWNFALTNNLIIVTNDEDFLNLSNLKSFPPKVVLLKIGNQSTTFIEATILNRISYIQSLHKSNEHGLLEIY